MRYGPGHNVHQIHMHRRMEQQTEPPARVEVLEVQGIFVHVAIGSGTDVWAIHNAYVLEQMLQSGTPLLGELYGNDLLILCPDDPADGAGMFHPCRRLERYEPCTDPAIGYQRRISLVG